MPVFSRRNRRKRPTFRQLVLLRVFAILFLGFSFIPAAVFFPEMYLAWRSDSWPTADGEITNSELRKERVGKKGSRFEFRPRVQYSFVVDNQTFHADRIRFGTLVSLKSAADPLAERYRVGKKVTVRYDPSGPSRAVIEPGPRSADYVVLGFALLLIAIGLLLVVGMFRVRSSRFCAAG